MNKVVGWILLQTESFLGALMPLGIVSLVLVMISAGITSLSYAFGITKSAPKTDGSELAVLCLAMIVIPLLLRIARTLEDISHEMHFEGSETKRLSR
ncbi:MAG TPA: hypothetical protein VEJ67_00555 [Candidatus Cybelea sp.]|nr:hypothetical protein [Candidatus Cybelea sp.]